MGLDTSHDCWHGPYSTFKSWRDSISSITGRRFNPEKYPNLEMILLGIWDVEPEDPIDVLIWHQDCEGSIPTRFTAPLADRLEEIAEKIGKSDEEGWMRDKTRGFILGLRKAADAGEDVDFY